MSDLVSVILPVYNAERYVELAIVSILTQSHKNIELIIVNDGSTDQSRRFIDAYASDPRVTVIHRENRGLVFSLNEALSIAKGKFIARMDADDISYVDRIKRQVQAMNNSPEISLVATNADYLFNDGHYIHKRASVMPPDVCRVEGLFHCPFVHPTVMLRASSVQTHGWRYDPAFPYCEDFELWSRILIDAKAIVLPFAGIAWRQGHASIRSVAYRVAIFDSMRIVERNLTLQGIQFTASSLWPFLQKDRQVSHNEKIDLRRCLECVTCSYTTPSERAAFMTGFQAFLYNLMFAAHQIGQPAALRPVLRDFRESGLNVRGRLKDLLVSTIPSRLNNTIFGIGQSLNRRLFGAAVARSSNISIEVRRILQASKD